jgi:hypothetical protein
MFRSFILTIIRAYISLFRVQVRVPVEVQVVVLLVAFCFVCTVDGKNKWPKHVCIKHKQLQLIYTVNLWLCKGKWISSQCKKWNLSSSAFLTIEETAGVYIGTIIISACSKINSEIHENLWNMVRASWRLQLPKFCTFKFLILKGHSDPYFRNCFFRAPLKRWLEVLSQYAFLNPLFWDSVLSVIIPESEHPNIMQIYPSNCQ